ncbi:MAG: hypothetical protein RSB71_04105 [Bacilli bacterium]
MKKINEILKKYDIKPYRYTTSGKATIVDTPVGRFVIKEKKRNNEIFKYLNSRSFNYYPKVINDMLDDYEITMYVDDIAYPKEQKMMDLITLTSLLHNKTTHYKEIDFDDYKKIYEDLLNNIEYLTSYYNDIITIIETHVYMSPSEYILARNINKIYASLNFCKKEIEKWYLLVKDKTKQRSVVLHNNLDLSHFIKNEKAYLISWDKTKIGMPIFDLYILYKRHALDYDFTEILKNYETSYPLQEDEKKLFFILIAMPPKIDFNSNEYKMTKKISEEIDLIYKTEKLISPYYSKPTVQNK